MIKRTDPPIINISVNNKIVNDKDVLSIVNPKTGKSTITDAATTME